MNDDYTTHFCKYKAEDEYIDDDTKFFAQRVGIDQFTCVSPNVTGTDKKIINS